MTRRILARLAAFGLAGLGLSPAMAALDIGDPVPKFTATAALGGKTFNYSLADALAKGPVVVYFFPAAGTTDCNIEAHAFAEAMEQFEAAGATVIGVSADDIDTLKDFSVKQCQSKFPVAADRSKAVIEGFDAVMQTRPDFANRLSYVVAPNGTVAYYYQNLNPDKHVERMLNALKALPKQTARR
ncbi:Putative peroxiredoxin bcp [Variovorax sp. PBS-H4]|uniref:peroxiredoxin n=1 Tax=Variovorax sp. PBS-H4 TaxID=434008 RepID=UPI001316151B|nr:peroxiredoxin [Variovorax sp. PBS-H4]VTU35672.1 Putative peroxiredoxin bcp [Variovorax sp. PBS-H4]